MVVPWHLHQESHDDDFSRNQEFYRQRRGAGPAPARSGPSDRRPGVSHSARPVGRGHLAHDDRGAHRAAGLFRRRPGHLARLPLRDRDALLRRHEPQPVRAPLGVRWLHVRLHRARPRARRGRAVRLGAVVVLRLHRHRRTGRLLDFRQPVPRRGRRSPSRPRRHLLRLERLRLLVHRLPGHPHVLAAHAGARRPVDYVDPRPVLYRALPAWQPDRHRAAHPQRRRPQRHQPRRRYLHLQPRRLRERDGPRRRSQEPPAQRAPRRRMEPGDHRPYLRLRQLRRGLRHPPLRHVPG